MADGAGEALADHRALVDHVESLVPTVDEVARVLVGAFAGGGRLFAFGNGGSAADAQHLVGELVGRYRRERRPLPASTLSVDPSALTCIGNDYAFDEVFSRQVAALARPGDVVVAYTTSGRSVNVVRGLEAAREAGATTILFAGGEDGMPAARSADHLLLVPSKATARVQEMHLLLMHLAIEQVDAWAAST